MQRILPLATVALVVALATVMACSGPTPAPETVAPTSGTSTDGSPDADRNPYAHGVAD